MAAVPLGESVGGGRGRTPYSAPTNEPSRATKAVNDWLHADAAARDYWHTQAVASRDKVAASPEAKGKSFKADDAAVAELSARLKTKLSLDVAMSESGLRQNLLFTSLAEVNWTELAEDLLYAR